MLLSSVTPAFNNTIYLVLKLPEADDLFGSSHGAVIDDGRLLSTATLHMVIHSIVAHVQLPSNKPNTDRCGPNIKYEQNTLLLFT